MPEIKLQPIKKIARLDLAPIAERKPEISPLIRPIVKAIRLTPEEPKPELRIPSLIRPAVEAIKFAKPIPTTDKPMVFEVGVGLTPDDVDGHFVPKKGTMVLCDRPCRIAKIDLEDKWSIESFITEEKYNQLVECVKEFITEGIVSKEREIPTADNGT